MDVELLKAGIKWAQAEHETYGRDGDWDQGRWYQSLHQTLKQQLEAQGVQTCGTRMCLAGWIVHQANINVINDSDVEWDETILGAKDADSDSDVPDAAAALLGIDADEAYELWAWDNGIEDFERIGRELAEKYGQEW